MIKLKQIEDLSVTIQKAEDNAKRYSDEKFEPIINRNTAFNKNFGTVQGTVAEGNHTHDVVTSSVDGFMLHEDKIKLDGIEAGANFYEHPTEEGFKHLPVVGVQGEGNFLKAGTTSGDAEWVKIQFTDLENTPTTLRGYGITDAVSNNEFESRLEFIELKLVEEEVTDSDVDSIINFIKGR